MGATGQRPLHFKQALSIIEKGEFPRSLFVYGSENALQDQLLQKLRQRYLSRVEREVNYFVRYASEFPVEQLTQLIQSGGLFSQKKLIEYRDYDQARNPKIKYLTHFLTRAPEDVLLVVTARTDQVQGKKYAPLLEHSLVVQLRPLYPEELRELVQAEAEKQGKRFSPEGLESFLEHTGNLLHHVYNALEQLIQTFPEQVELGVAEVESVVGDYAYHTVFEFTESLLSGQRARAHELLGYLMEQGENPQGIFFWLIRHFTNLWRLHGYLQAGERNDRVIQRALGLYPRQYERLRRQAARWSPQQVRQVLLNLRNLEALSRTSQAPSHILLDLITSKLVNLQ